MRRFRKKILAQLILAASMSLALACGASSPDELRMEPGRPVSGQPGAWLIQAAVSTVDSTRLLDAILGSSGHHPDHLGSSGVY